MKSQLFRFIIIFCAVSACLSCEKLALSPDPAASPEEVFDYLWEDINNRYTYFEEKNINWNSVGVAMRTKIHGDMSDIELFQVLGKMLFVLKDGHVNLTSSFDRSRNWEWFENYHLNYSQNLIDNHYLGLDFRAIIPEEEAGCLLLVSFPTVGSTGFRHHRPSIRKATILNSVCRWMCLNLWYLQMSRKALTASLKRRWRGLSSGGAFLFRAKAHSVKM